MLQAKKIELNFPSFTLRHPGKSLLNLKNAHNANMIWDSASSSERFWRNTTQPHVAWRRRRPIPSSVTSVSSLGVLCGPRIGSH